MTRSDDKPRSGSNIREASRLRATLGSEPSSGYAFHDKVRVDRVERPRAPRPPTGAPPVSAAQAASHAPRERSFAQTLVGGMTLQEALNQRALPLEPTPDNDPQVPAMGWPSMPQVPQELQGSVEDSHERPRSQRPEPNPFDAGPSTGSGAKKVSSNPPAGGAIWQAMPSVITLPASPEEPAPGPASAPPSAPPPARPERMISTDPPRNSRPVGFRLSAAELEANYASSYRDPRLLKYEGMVERNAWEELHEQISREAARLSPELRLLAIVAQRETLKGDRKQDAHLTQEAIAVVAQLLQVPPASPTALVIGKRLLRKNPGWTNKQAPTAGLSLGVLIGGIAAGAGVGWLVTTLLF